MSNVPLFQPTSYKSQPRYKCDTSDMSDSSDTSGTSDDDNGFDCYNGTEYYTSDDDDCDESKAARSTGVYTIIIFILRKNI